MRKKFVIEFEFLNNTQLMLDGNKLAAMAKIFLEKEPSTFSDADIKKYNQFVKLLQSYLKDYMGQLDIFEQNISLDNQLIFQTIGGENESNFISNLDLLDENKVKKPWWKFWKS